MGGPLDTMRSLEQFLPGDQPRGFMGPDSGPKGQFLQITFFSRKYDEKVSKEDILQWYQIENQ